MSKLKRWHNKTWGDKVFIITVYVICILLTLICLYPLYFTVVASISNPRMVYHGDCYLIPKGINLNAYTQVFKNGDIWKGYANTAFYTFFGTLFNLVLTIPAAYALSRPNFLGKSFIMKLFMITMYFGGGIIPTYIQIGNMGLMNTRILLVILGGVSVYNVIVTRTFFQSNISESLLEAARIDGANEFYIFGRIVLPLSGAIIAVMTLYYAVGHWNSYFSAMIYISNNDLHPLQLVLRRILISGTALVTDTNQLSGTNKSDAALIAQAEKEYLALSMKYSLVFISSLPMLIMYPFVQKHFVKGVMVGSVKG